jgi:5-formyltetrahydrofolate cyclo-ligase
MFMEKADIRRQVLTARARMDVSLHSDLSRRAQESLIDSDVFARAGAIALYSPVNNETATELIFVAATESGKKVYYPRVDGDGLNFFEVCSLLELTPGAFDVLEPRTGRRVTPERLDLVVLPGVAFDRDGRRLGYGKGFYDRFLADEKLTLATVGLGFDFQVRDSLPEEAHDRKISFLATETGFFAC